MGITRAEILKRARSVPQNSVPYSQSTIGFPGRYRSDCSGYVSMAWGIAPNGPGCWGGFSTVSAVLNGYMKEIPWASLLPGDAIGHCGPGTGGDYGHIILVVTAPDKKGGISTLEQSGGRSGPHTGLYSPQSGYKAYRFTGVSEAPVTVPPEMSLGGRKMFFVQLNGHPEVFLSNGMQAVWLSPQSLADFKTLAAEGRVDIPKTDVRKVGNRGVIGQIIGNVPKGYSANA